jgi:hypothetical protein
VAYLAILIRRIADRHCPPGQMRQSRHRPAGRELFRIGPLSADCARYLDNNLRNVTQIYNRQRLAIGGRGPNAPAYAPVLLHSPTMSSSP